MRGWLVSWWKDLLPLIHPESARYGPWAFYYVIVGLVDPADDPCRPSNWKVTEFGMGAYPDAPEEWLERDGVMLAEAAIVDLQRKA